MKPMPARHLDGMHRLEFELRWRRVFVMRASTWARCSPHGRKVGELWSGSICRKLYTYTHLYMCIYICISFMGAAEKLRHGSRVV